MRLLEVDQLQVAYGGIRAIKGISFEVKQGELVCLLGANGAGKTTTLKALTALHPKLSGSILFQHTATDGLGAWELAKRGLVMVPEGRGSFTRMTILENLQMGAYLRNDHGIHSDLERVFELFPRLKERYKQLAGTLSGGEQQMLAMGRALMARPSLLLLDEPSMGLSPMMVEKIFEVIRSIHQEGMTILLVEQNASRALRLADRAYVLDSGEMLMQGEAAAMLDDPRVRAAYLGE